MLNTLKVIMSFKVTDNKKLKKYTEYTSEPVHRDSDK